MTFLFFLFIAVVAIAAIVSSWALRSAQGKMTDNEDKAVLVKMKAGFDFVAGICLLLSGLKEPLFWLLGVITLWVWCNDLDYLRRLRAGSRD